MIGRILTLLLLVLVISGVGEVPGLYKQKIPTVDAIQWQCNNIAAVIAFTTPATLTRIDPTRPGAVNMIGVPTVEGVIACDCKGAPGTSGDWILKKDGLLTVQPNTEFTLRWEPGP